MIRALTRSPEETRDLAGALSHLAGPGDVLLLVGDLGAGKTTFAQGFGRGLGVEGQVTSPTFTLVHSYSGRLTMIHADLYRLDTTAEIDDLGLPELLDGGAVALVEWGDVAGSLLAPEYLEVCMEPGAGTEDRTLDVAPVGSTWCGRSPAIATALRPWAPGR